MAAGPSPDRAEPRPVVGDVFHQAAVSPDAIALVTPADATSYADLACFVRGVASELVGRGVRPGDRVLVQASSTLPFVACYLAVHFARGIAVPVDAAIPPSRRAALSDRVAARAALAIGEQEDLLAAARKGRADFRLNATPMPVLDNDADILFTSGTTGLPKGVVLTHRNQVAAVRQAMAFIGTRSNDVAVLPLPLSHSFGLGSLRVVLAAGATAVLVDGFAFPGRIYAALEEHGGTAFHCVPAGLSMMLRYAPERLADFARQIRYVEIASASMPIAEKHRLMRLLPNSRICMQYGLTEAARAALIAFHDETDHLDSVGRPCDGVEMRIAGPDGASAGPGLEGEIQIRGPNVMRGYWNDPERNRETFSEGGWLRTGDQGRMDAEGRFYMHGRSSEMINVGGRKVSPVEVEEALRDYPSVLDCACVGIADPAGVSGDAVAVLVVMREGSAPDPRTLRNFLRDRLEPYKLPSKWTFSGTVPRTANGKVQRHTLRAQLQAASE